MTTENTPTIDHIAEVIAVTTQSEMQDPKYQAFKDSREHLRRLLHIASDDTLAYWMTADLGHWLADVQLVIRSAARTEQYSRQQHS